VEPQENSSPLAGEVRWGDVELEGKLHRPPIQPSPARGEGFPRGTDSAPLESEIHPIARLSDAWRDDLDFLMLLVPKANAVGWEGRGDFVTDEHGRIRRPREGEDAPYIFTGVEIIHPRVFVGCPGGAFSLSHLWNARMGADGYFTRMRAIIHHGAWLNVGDLAGLAQAEAYSGNGSAGSLR
jgi:N-acetyl-alpha-D-muramate 1-phosphate uridylyltransferase